MRSVSGSLVFLFDKFGGVIELMSGEKRTILLVDDEPYVLEMMEIVLGKLGYNTITAQNGASALETYDRIPGQIDAVILDLTMPDVSGWEVANELIARNPSVKIIISSGAVEEPDRENGVKITAFCPKPISIVDLEGKVRAALAQNN